MRCVAQDESTAAPCGYGEVDCRCLVHDDEPALSLGDVVSVDAGDLPIVGFRAHGRLVELLGRNGQTLCYPRAPFGVPLVPLTASSQGSVR